MIKKDWLVLLIVFAFGYFLRVVFLSRGALTFGYDQARDAMVTQQILAGDFKILGPPASTPGLYHGVFYYYFLVPAYFVSHNPLAAAYWTAVFNAATAFVVYYLTFLMVRKRGAALLAAFLF
jgi:4-amino-4-deoxy-L-arabinose transferase-like glycosyltransferase